MSPLRDSSRGVTMLLWEILRRNSILAIEPADHDVPRRVHRLAYDKRCAAITKSGRRCRGRILPDADFCPFHHPDVVARRRQAMSAASRGEQRRLSRLPGGYLRKLSTRASVGTAMDRLYRDVRLGEVTPEMGSVLFGILTRILDSELLRPGAGKPNGRARADRIRPKLHILLTRAERAAWNKAIAESPSMPSDTDAGVPQKIAAPVRARVPRPRRENGRPWASAAATRTQ